MSDLFRFVAGLATDLFRGPAALVAENGLLRQQLIVAERKLVGRAVGTVAALDHGLGRAHRAGLALGHFARPAGDDPPLAPRRIPRVLAATFATRRSAAHR